MTPLMAPPHNAVTTRAPTDSSTPDQPRGNGMHGATDPPHAPIALQRWDSDGGAVQ
jgi:hypothetical protein